MTAFTGTPAATARYTSQIAPYTKAPAASIEGVKQYADSGLYTHALGTGTGEVNLLKLPAGKIRVLVDNSRLVTSQFEANADIHIGHRAYVGSDGVAVAEDDNSLHDNGDAGGGALDTALALPAVGFKDYDSQDGVILYAMIDTGDIADADTIHLHIEYIRLR